MMLQLTALAMNQNLSEAEFLELSARTIDAQARLMELACNGFKDLAKEYDQQTALSYLNQVLPIVFMF